MFKFLIAICLSLFFFSEVRAQARGQQGIKKNLFFPINNIKVKLAPGEKKVITLDHPISHGIELQGKKGIVEYSLKEDEGIINLEGISGGLVYLKVLNPENTSATMLNVSVQKSGEGFKKKYSNSMPGQKDDLAKQLESANPQLNLTTLDNILSDNSSEKMKILFMKNGELEYLVANKIGQGNAEIDQKALKTLEKLQNEKGPLSQETVNAIYQKATSPGTKLEDRLKMMNLLSSQQSSANKFNESKSQRQADVLSEKVLEDLLKDVDLAKNSRSSNKAPLMQQKILESLKLLGQKAQENLLKKPENAKKLCNCSKDSCLVWKAQEKINSPLMFEEAKKGLASNKVTTEEKVCILEYLSKRGDEQSLDELIKYLPLSIATPALLSSTHKAIGDIAWIERTKKAQMQSPVVNSKLQEIANPILKSMGHLNETQRIASVEALGKIGNSLALTTFASLMYSDNRTMKSTVAYASSKISHSGSWSILKGLVEKETEKCFLQCYKNLTTELLRHCPECQNQARLESQKGDPLSQSLLNNYKKNALSNPSFEWDNCKKLCD